MQIYYKNAQEAWDNYHSFLSDLILRHKFKKICEIGGGANPAIDLSFIHARGIEYTLLDISKTELEKAPSGYLKVEADIADKDISLPENTYDFIFSKMLAEHISDGKQFHLNVKKLLKPGGMAFHFFPTLFCPPFSLNKILPEQTSYQILTSLSKERHKKGNFGKFPAYYSMCYGPSKKQMNAFMQLGYEINTYIGFFGHGYYTKIPVLNFLSQLATKFLLRFPVSLLTSYSYVLLVKPPLSSSPFPQKTLEGRGICA